MPENNQGYDKKQVNFWVDPDQKDRWQAYLDEESEFQHLSQLARQAIEREIQQSDDTNGSAEPSEAFDAYFDEIRGSINQLEQVMQEVEKRLSGLEREVRDDPQVRQLANEVFEILPSKDDIKEYQNIAKHGTPPEHVAPRAQAGTIDGIADSLEAETHEVRAALDRLQQDTHQVHTVDWDDKTRYYKEA
jgi:hypothetical protein